MRKRIENPFAWQFACGLSELPLMPPPSPTPSSSSPAPQEGSSVTRRIRTALSNRQATDEEQAEEVHPH